MKPGLDSVAVFALLVAASAKPSLAIEDNEVPPTPQDDICGIITASADADGGSPWFWASSVYECLTSVPFNSAVASRFIKYYNETLQFHSTIDLLKAPPASYRRAPVDLLQGLADIQTKVDAETYHNQYAFEHELQSLIISAHDAHLRLYAGVLNQFTFGSYYEVIALSEDGHKTPEIYVRDVSLEECLSEPGCKPSPIESMNDIDVVDFLSEFAANQSFGLLESHADWNQLMMTPALSIQGGLTTFGGVATLYPGDELNIKLKNGSHDYDYYFLSLYNSPGYTGPLTTGGDFYNFFVLGLPPASYDPDSYFDNLSAVDEGDTNFNMTLQTSWYNENISFIAYPDKTLVYQQDLGLSGSGIVTGYQLDDISTAVLSIPSFSTYVDTFSQTLKKFVIAAENSTKVIIDLQQNTGGDVALALEAFRWFFPGINPFTGSRMRAHDTANVLGSNINDYFDSLNSSSEADEVDYLSFLTLEWVATNRINAQTGQNFTSWADYFGPRQLNGGLFTHTQQYNLTSELFDIWNLGADFPLDQAFNVTAPKEEFPWSTENIVILTDGLCSSACSLFVELMTQQAGVRTVVVGGSPKSGAMQAVSGSRGAAAYSSSLLDADIDTAIAINATAQASLPLRGNVTDSGMVVNYAGINLRDQVEKNATLPNQMRYLPADCRIYWSFANFNNYTRLWHDVSTAIYEDPGLCVPGSTNVTKSSIERRDSASRVTSGVSTQDQGISPYIVAGLDGLPIGSGVDDKPPASPSGFPVQCGTTKRNQATCDARKDGTRCMPITVACNECTLSRAGSAPSCKGGNISEFRCLKKCNSGLEGGGTGNCGYETYCPGGSQTNSNVNANGSGKSGVSMKSRVTTSSYCYPVPPFSSQQCSQIKTQWARYSSGSK